MKKKDSKYLLFIIIILILIVIVLFTMSNGKKNEEIKEENKILLLKDYSRFYTINSCVYKYIVNVSSKNTENILKILDKDYVDNNLINKNNLYNYVEDINGNYTFETKKIYYEKIKNNYYKYYVYGMILEETIDGVNGDGINTYYIVKMDINNKTFSISPYDGKIFKEVNNE